MFIPVLRVIALLLIAAPGAFAKLTPLTVSDVSLMLRTGYSVAEVQQELARKFFLGPIDPAAEQHLLKAGASPALVAALKSGTYAPPPGEIAAAEREQAEQAKRRQLQAEEAKKFNTLHQEQLAQQRAAPVSSGTHTLAAQLRGSLVRSTNGSLTSVDAEPLAQKKLIALYFSAYWCGPCRRFTPELVQFYNRNVAAHPEFELVFVSADRSASAMAQYMRDMQMPWPAVEFDKIKDKSELLKYAGSGIPGLVVIDAEGRVLSASHEGTRYLGPRKVLTDLEKIFTASTAVTQR